MSNQKLFHQNIVLNIAKIDVIQPKPVPNVGL